MHRVLCVRFDMIDHSRLGIVVDVVVVVLRRYGRRSDARTRIGVVARAVRVPGRWLVPGRWRAPEQVLAAERRHVHEQLHGLGQRHVLRQRREHELAREQSHDHERLQAVEQQLIARDAPGTTAHCTPVEQNRVRCVDAHDMVTTLAVAAAAAAANTAVIDHEPLLPAVLECIAPHGPPDIVAAVLANVLRTSLAPECATQSMDQRSHTLRRHDGHDAVGIGVAPAHIAGTHPLRKWSDIPVLLV